MILFLLPLILSVSLGAAISANSHQVIILRLNGQQPAVCSGSLVANNMIATSAQCVAMAQPQAMRITSGAWKAAQHNVSRIHINSRYDPNTLQADVALLQLQNGTALAAEAVRLIPIDFQEAQWTNCTVSFAHNSTNGLTQTVNFPDVFHRCERFQARNLTTCTSYPVQDRAMCAGNANELFIDRGTPLVCRGMLTGLLSNIVKVPAPAIRPYEMCTANAYYSRFDHATAEWIKQVINANRPNVPHIPAPQEALANHVTKWVGAGIARPAPVVPAAPAPAVIVVHHVAAPAPVAQAPPPRVVHIRQNVTQPRRPHNVTLLLNYGRNQNRTLGRKNAGALERSSIGGVGMGICVFLMLTYF